MTNKLLIINALNLWIMLCNNIYLILKKKIHIININTFP